MPVAQCGIYFLSWQTHISDQDVQIMVLASFGARIEADVEAAVAPAPQSNAKTRPRKSHDKSAEGRFATTHVNGQVILRSSDVLHKRNVRPGSLRWTLVNLVVLNNRQVLKKALRYHRPNKVDSGVREIASKYINGGSCENGIAHTESGAD